MTGFTEETKAGGMEVLSRPTLALGRVLGIPLYLNYSWFPVFFLLTLVLANVYYPANFKYWTSIQYWAVAAVSAILLFASVVFHELGHAVLATRSGITVRSITLFFFGGAARIGSAPQSARAEFLIAAAGPVASLALATAFLLLHPLAAGVPTLAGLVRYVAVVNIGLVVFNLIPGFPLDGGRILRALVWALTNDHKRATILSARAGQFFGAICFAAGGWRIFQGHFNGFWIVALGWFLASSASAQISRALATKGPVEQPERIEVPAAA